MKFDRGGAKTPTSAYHKYNKTYPQCQIEFETKLGVGALQL